MSASPQPRRATRDPLIDALRALALFGVVVVNVYGYPTAPLRFAVLDADPAASTFDRLLDGLVGALLIAKAYPVLTFLFGYSLVLADRRGAHSRTRLKRLAGLGAVHGALLYFGDILLPYAVAGWWATLQLRGRLTSLKRQLIAWWGVALILSVGLTMLAAVFPADPSALAAEPSFADTEDWRAWSALNVTTWLITVSSSLLLLPQLMALVLLGVFAARLRLLTHRRWQVPLHRWAGRALVVALAANAAMALCLVLPSAQASGVNLWVASLTWPIGPALGLAAMGWVTSHWRGQRSAELLGLAALGRRTLSVYLVSSLAAVLLLSGPGKALPLDRLGLLALAGGLWIAAWGWAQWAERRGWRGPAEAWIARP